MNHGIMKTALAIELAKAAGLEIVTIRCGSVPRKEPVCEWTRTAQLARDFFEERGVIQPEVRVSSFPDWLEHANRMAALPDAHDAFLGLPMDSFYAGFPIFVDSDDSGPTLPDDVPTDPMLPPSPDEDDEERKTEDSFPCKVCKRPNTISDTSCWWCGVLCPGTSL
jgi:hypothetical protein